LYKVYRVSPANMFSYITNINTIVDHCNLIYIYERPIIY